MSLAGQFQPQTPLFLRVLVRLGWLLALIYPLIFFAVVLLAERVLARRSYAAAAMVALLPIAFSLFVIRSLLVAVNDRIHTIQLAHARRFSGWRRIAIINPITGRRGLRFGGGALPTRPSDAHARPGILFRR
jgi:hypothetical protein